MRVTLVLLDFTAQKMKFSIKDFFSKFDQIRRKLRIWSHLLKKSLMENFIFCAVFVQTTARIKDTFFDYGYKLAGVSQGKYHYNVIVKTISPVFTHLV